MNAKHPTPVEHAAILVHEPTKAMLINSMAGSGGDALPWYFKKLNVGPLVGTRTWGGLVASRQGPRLMDGGFYTAPDAAVYGLDGQWEVENAGVAPDIEVELDPAAWRQGRDTQLERRSRTSWPRSRRILGKFPGRLRRRTNGAAG